MHELLGERDQHESYEDDDCVQHINFIWLWMKPQEVDRDVAVKPP